MARLPFLPIREVGHALGNLDVQGNKGAIGLHGRFDRRRDALDGDGDWVRAQPPFGLLVENAYHAIYRMWTRP